MVQYHETNLYGLANLADSDNSLVHVSRGSLQDEKHAPLATQYQPDDQADRAQHTRNAAVQDPRAVRCIADSIECN